MPRSKKMQAKGHAILKAKINIKPPEFNILDYKLSMIRALNYYSSEIDDKEKRKFAYAYWKSQGKDVAKLNSLSDSWFSTVGAVAHMANSDIPLHDHDLIRLDNAYNQLLDKVEIIIEEKAETKSKPTKSIQDYIDDAAKVHIAEIEAAYDELMTKGQSFDCKNYLIKNQVKGPVAKRIMEWFKLKQIEFSAAYEDQELAVAYGGKKLLTKFINLSESIINDCTTIEQIAKTTRQPRKRKEKPPAVLAAKMVYMKVFADLNLKSITADKIVGADQAFLYNTKTRRLIKYQSLDGYTLSIKGRAIQNFDPEKSGSKIVRKPEDVMKGISNLTKRPINNLFNGINATPGKVIGRVNEETIIIGAFI